MDDSPLVSVGIPTFNRPEGLQNTLESITSQTYRNLEIIVSDNASSSEEVEKVVYKFQQNDPRIKYFRQEENKGPAYNFQFVLKHSTGKYFMWAADDDVWENFYIKRLVQFLELPSSCHFVAVNFEAQYIDGKSNRFDFFAEGRFFYKEQLNSSYERIKFMLLHNYGDIIYSLYRRDILINNELIFVQNEIPFLLQVIQYGNWKVLPDVGFYKRTVLPTYNQARWEMEGGYLTPDKIHFWNRLIQFCPSFSNSYGYHHCALENILKAIDSLEVDSKEKRILKFLAVCTIWKHLITISTGYKRQCAR
jgi:glycosyltransferase involved in cell wall biosynthesis